MRIPFLALAAVAAMILVVFSSPATASAASCAAAPVGGENAPTVNNTAGTLSETGEQGYSCTVKWQAAVFARYESGGTWHYANDTNPGFHPNIPGFAGVPAGGTFEWPLQGRNLTDPDWTWTPTLEIPVCAFNWKIEVDFFTPPGGNVFATSTSAETHKTC